MVLQIGTLLFRSWWQVAANEGKSAHAFVMVQNRGYSGVVPAEGAVWVVFGVVPMVGFSLVETELNLWSV